METFISSKWFGGVFCFVFRRFYTILQKGWLNCTGLSRDRYLAESRKEFTISDKMVGSKKGEQLLVFIYRTQKTAFCILSNGRYPPYPKTFCTYPLLKTLLPWTRLIFTWPPKSLWWFVGFLCVCVSFLVSVWMFRPFIFIKVSTFQLFSENILDLSSLISIPRLNLIKYNCF